MSKNTFTGFGLIETIVALGVFSIIVSAGILGFIPALQSGRIGREQTQAVAAAQEGIEAVRSIRDRNFASIVGGTFGIGVSSNLWAFSGSSDVNDKFTRKIIISQASRDAGNSLVTSGGSTDPDTFLVSSNVSWNYSVGDTRQVTINNYLTNWRKAIGGVSFDGLLVFGRGTSTTFAVRNYTDSSNAFSVAANGTVGGNPRSMILRTSPLKTEAIMAAVNNTGSLYVYCFDGSTWSQDWTVNIGVTATTRAFNLEYETNSGDVIVVYGTGATTTNEIAYRTKSNANGCGSGQWSGATNFDPVRTSAKVLWVKTARDRRSSSDLIAFNWADTSNDLSAAIWDGSTFTNEPGSAIETNLEIGTTSAALRQDVDSFDLEYESGGDLMVAWGRNTGTNGVNGAYYQMCNGGTSSCTWGAGVVIPGLLDDATNLDISANPGSDQIVFASVGNAGSDLQAGYWNGSTWSVAANLDTSAQVPASGTHLVDTAWLASAGTTRSVIVYNDSGTTNIGWYVGTAGTFTLQTDSTVSPVFTSPQRWYDLQNDPINRDRLMFVLSDNSNRLFAKRLVMTSTPAFTWTNADGAINLGTTLSQNITSPFGFAYLQQ